MIAPAGWTTVTLDAGLEVLIDHRGKTPGKLGGKFETDGVPAISAMNIKNGTIDWSLQPRYVSTGIFSRWMRVPLRAGDVLMTSEAPLGQLAVVSSDEPLVLSQRLYGMRGKVDLLDNGFLRWFLEAPQGRDQLTARASGSTVTGIRQAELRQVRVVLPPIAEQRRIVEILEDNLSRLDAANSGLRMAHLRVSAMLRSALDHYFGLRRDTMTVGDAVSDIAAGKSFGTAAAPAGPDEWGIIRVSAMTWGAFDGSKNKAVDSAKVDPRFEIRPGDLLVSRANTNEYVGASGPRR